METTITPDALALRWLLDVGVTDMVMPQPQPWIGKAEPIVSPLSSPARLAPAAPVGGVVGGALSGPIDAVDLPALYAAIQAFDGCPLKRTATNTVIFDGVAASRVMIIGEAPGADEDRVGKPFVGLAGQLLDRMLASIGRDRLAEDAASAVYITNILFWRPPGNRTPTPTEVAICLPFVRRHIALVDPVAILAVGAPAIHALTGTSDAVGKLRGRWHIIEIDGKSYPLMATYHPAYLLRQPAHKHMAWHDLLLMAEKLKEQSA
jgi:uracil-DNA glycosylase